MAKCLELKAYDFMLRFDKSFNGFETVGTAYDFIALCCKRCKVEFASKRAEIDAMPNGEVTLSVYTENDIETCRDVLFYVAQVLGGFFIINREGKLELRKYGKDPVMKVEQSHRFSSSFSDFITKYTAVSSTNKQTQIAEYYALDPDNGLTMNLGVNPLLQFGLEETREMLCRNILADLSVIRYVPFDSDTIGNPALDPGDVLTFAGGQADEGQITCITSIRQKIGGKQSLKCVGKNPRLAQAKSRNDKNISGLLNQIEDNAKTGKIGIHTFTNASAHEIGQTKVKLISIQFASSEENHMQFFAQVVVEVAADPVERSAEASGTVVIPFPGGSGSGTGSGTGGSDGTGEASDAGSSENDVTGSGNTSGNENTGSTDDVSGGSDSGSGSGSGSEVSVDVSLPVKWQEDDGTGKLYTVIADFRKYSCVEQSIADHSAYLLGAMNGKKKRYAGLAGEKDYRKAVQIIKDGGYATDSLYVQKICVIIERYGLTRFDGVKTEKEVWYRVRKSWQDAESQVGAFKVLDNAKKCADEHLGFSVFDENEKAVYSSVDKKPEEVFRPYLVRVEIPDLNIRKKPGTDQEKTGKYTGAGCFTIVAEADGVGASKWGLLKACEKERNGWISLDYVTKIR